MDRYDRYDRDYSRDYSRRRGYDYDRDDRGFFDRASDEVRSWFGDDDAERRRDRDHRYDGDRFGDRDFGDEDARRASRRYRSDYDSRSGRSDYDSRSGRSDYDSRSGRSDYDSRYGRSGYGSARSDADRYSDDYQTAGFGARTYQSGYDRSGDDRDRYYSRSRRYSRDAFRSDSDYGSRFGRSASYDRDAFGTDTNRYDGPHSGVGPSGYSRSQDRIEEDVNERLTHHGMLDATNIRVSVDDDGDVTLEGTVGSRREKRLADDVAESVRGVDDVHNRLRVQRQDSDRTSSRSAGNGSSDASNASDGTKARANAAAS